MQGLDQFPLLGLSLFMASPCLVDLRLFPSHLQSCFFGHALGYTFDVVNQFGAQGGGGGRGDRGNKFFEVALNGAFGTGIAEFHPHCVNARMNPSGD